MANNIQVKDGNGNLVTLCTIDTGGGVELNTFTISDATFARQVAVKPASTRAAAADVALVVRPMVPTDGTNDTPTMDAVGRPGFQQITDGAHTLGLQQFHSADNQSLGTFYGIGAGGVGQCLNISGNLDRARGVAGDNMSAQGLPVDVSLTMQIFPPTIATNSPTSGSAKTINVPSTANITAGGLVKVDVGSVSEYARVTSIVANTSVTVDALVSNHTLPAVFPIVFNSPRDAGGEQDLAPGTGATLAVDYNFDGTAYQRARNAFGLGVYSDTSASNVAAGNNVIVTTAGTPPTLASGQTLPCLIIDSANSKNELAIIIATNPGGKTVTFQTLAAAYNGSVTALQLRAPTQSLLAAPVNFNGWGLAADLAVVYSGLDANSVMQFSVEKDVNAAGLNPTQAAVSAAGMDADVDYGIFRTWANRPALTDKQMTPLQQDVNGALLVGGAVPGTPLLVGANVGASANNQTLAGTAAKMTFISGFDVFGLGATAGSAIKITVTGLQGGQTLTYDYVVPAGVTTAAPQLSIRYNPPLQANAVNTAIVVSVPSFGAGNTSASASAFGFQL